MQEQQAVRALDALAQPLRLKVFRRLVVAGQQGLTPGALAEALVTALRLGAAVAVGVDRRLTTRPEHPGRHEPQV